MEIGAWVARDGGRWRLVHGSPEMEEDSKMENLVHGSPEMEEDGDWCMGRQRWGKIRRWGKMEIGAWVSREGRLVHWSPDKGDWCMGLQIRGIGAWVARDEKMGDWCQYTYTISSRYQLHLHDVWYSVYLT